MLGLTKTSDYNLMRDDRDATVHMVQHLLKRIAEFEQDIEKLHITNKRLYVDINDRDAVTQAAVGQLVALQERLDLLHLIHGNVLKERDTLSAKYNFIKDTLQTVIENE